MPLVRRRFQRTGTDRVFGPSNAGVRDTASTVGDMSEPKMLKNEDENRYELHVDGSLVGTIDYKREGETVELPHTEVDKEHGGQGYAGKLADFALRDLSEAGLMVKPTCPYIAQHIDQNPEFGSLVAGEDPAEA